MIISKEALLQRKAELEKEHDVIVGHLNTYKGGIADVNYWLGYIEKVEEQNMEGTNNAD